MADVTLKATARANKYGHVIINNPDGSFNRDYLITEAELAELHRSGNGIPPGVTQEEHDGRIDRTPKGHPFQILESCVTVIGKGMDVGDAVEIVQDVVDKTGVVVESHVIGLHVLFSMEKDPALGRYVEKVLKMEVGDWSGACPNISVAAQKLPPEIASLSNGVLRIATAATDIDSVAG